MTRRLTLPRVAFFFLLSTQFAASKFSLAGVRFGQTLQPDFVDFLTTLCYNDIVTVDPSVAPGRKAHL